MWAPLSYSAALALVDSSSAWRKAVLLKGHETARFGHAFRWRERLPSPSMPNDCD